MNNLEQHTFSGANKGMLPRAITDCTIFEKFKFKMLS